MLLEAGSRVGVYEIVAALGRGGMGEVYRARDPKLRRDVAIKILPHLFAHDPDRVSRFQREAQVLASLNHPNIAQIYGLDDSAGLHALVLELVEGPTLEDRIARGALNWTDAVPIARQIAEALEAAHEHGIIHRDLKPANVKVTPDGRVKVLDFGLAKLAAPDGAHGADHDLLNSPTMTGSATEAGMILGTASYMAPEQAQGQTRGQARRHLGVWRPALRDVDRPPAVSRSFNDRGACGNPQGRPRTGPRFQPMCLCRCGAW